MRVLFLTHRLPYAPNRGDRLRAHHVLHELARWAEVDLVSLAHDREEEARATDLRQVAATVMTARVPRVRAFARAVPALATARPLTHVLLDAPALRPALRRLVKERPPDVVLALCSSMARFALEPPLRPTPLVVDLIDVDSEKWAALARTTRIPKRWIYRREAGCLSRFEAAAARCARATLVVNERERALLMRLAPDATTYIVPNGVDRASFRPDGPPAPEPRVVFCGVMNYPPNEEAAIWLARTVWPLVTRHRPGATLSIVGSEPTAAVRKLASGDRVIQVTGGVPDVRPFLWSAAISVAPLKTARGVQNKVLEAVAAGLPCVVTPAVWQGLPAAITPACRVADAPEDFADEILRLLASSPGERRGIARRADVTSLSWAARLTPLRRILETAATQGHAADNHYVSAAAAHDPHRPPSAGHGC